MNNAGRPQVRTAGIVLAVLVSVLLAGCYRFTPAEVASLSPGAPVRLRLTDDGSAMVAAYIGPRMESVDGVITEFAGDSAVVVRMQQTMSRGGAVTEWAGESLSVPRRAIAGAERKTRSPQRTALAAAGGVAAVVAIAAGFNLFGSFGGGRGGPSGSPK
jgi:hypothetical protein